MLFFKPDYGDLVMWEHTNIMISSKPLVTIHGLSVIEAHELTHSSAIAQFGQWMVVVAEASGKMWFLASKECYTPEGFNRENPGAKAS